MEPKENSNLEAALRGLKPEAGRIDRDRLMFRAGQASVAGETKVRQSAAWGKFLWPLSTAALLLLSVSLGTALVIRERAAQQVVMVVHGNESNARSENIALQAPGETNVAASPRDASYLQIRNLVLTHGVEALPRPMNRPSEKQSQPALVWPALGTTIDY